MPKQYFNVNLLVTQATHQKRSWNSWNSKIYFNIDWPAVMCVRVYCVECVRYKSTARPKAEKQKRSGTRRKNTDTSVAVVRTHTHSHTICKRRSQRRRNQIYLYLFEWIKCDEYHNAFEAKISILTIISFVRDMYVLGACLHVMSAG